MVGEGLRRLDWIRKGGKNHSRQFKGCTIKSRDVKKWGLFIKSNINRKVALRISAQSTQGSKYQNFKVFAHSGANLCIL